MKGDPYETRYADKIRDIQNWINGSDYSPRNAMHVPPAPERVHALMIDLQVFCVHKDIPALGGQWKPGSGVECR